jgi:FMN phosphatase YigB (HAD superfamily)
MLPLRIGFDMDGTLADLSSAYAEVEERLFGPVVAVHEQPAPEEREQQQHQEEGEDGPPPAAATKKYNRPSQLRRSAERSAGRREKVWRAIESTPDFWTTLKPIDPAAITRLHQLTAEYHWEVFFITQRPATAGRTVQWQTHTWLVEHGFTMPNVIPLSRSRGKAAAALLLDYLVDDSPQNCVDVLSDSRARAILLVDDGDSVAESSARRLGIGTARSISEALDLLVQATEARNNPSLFDKLRKLVGWK